MNIQSENRPGELGRTVMHYIASLDRRRRRFLNEGLAELGLSGPMPNFLLTLERSPGVSQDFLAEQLKIDKSGIARLARELEELGYIRRELSSGNRRMYRLFLTESGEKVLPVIRSQLSLWRETVMSGISSDKQTEMVQLLSQMVENSTKL